ncbi:42393_t:CDS:2, partial [Gigaspora margarita]
EEIPQNVLVKVNKNNKNILLQQMEQTNMDIQTQLAEAPVVDNDDTSKQSWAKIIDNNSDNLKNITNATNPWATPITINKKSTYDEKAETLSVSDDRSDEEMVVKSLDSLKITKEGNTHKETVETPIITSVCPDEEMTTEPSDPLRDELSNLYGTAENKKNLLLVAATKATGVVDM